jgi:multidrug resistance protein MdtO
VSVNSEKEQTLWQWLPEFFRHELAPYPGRWSLVGRMVIAATLSMIVIVTFRIPYGAIGVNCAFILSRENLTATAKSGLSFILAFAVWAVLTPIGARMFASIPITHFVWEGVTAFLCFFLLKTLTNFPLATGVVVVATATMTIWYLPGPAEMNVELTLWQILATSIGALITFLVEVVFRYWSRQDPLLDGMDDRLRAIEDMLRDYSKGVPANSNIIKALTQYAVTGTGLLREQIARNHSDVLKRMKMNALVSLLSRSINLSAALVSGGEDLELASTLGAERLANRINAIRRSIDTGDLLSAAKAAKLTEYEVPVLSELNVAVSLMESVLVTSDAADPDLVSLDAASSKKLIFVEDAFTNPEHLKYALAGTAASMLCYVIYVGLHWPGVSTAVTTCALTALSNIGSSRQKQVLRIVGASIGGFVLGLGSQVFLLPYIDSIVGLTIVFALATGVSAYVATSSPRLSYLGLQMAFAFYLINVTDFSISLDLTIGRDRAVGVLLGIGGMWLIFDHLYSRSAGIEMVAGFARATRQIARLTEILEGECNQTEINRIRALRNDVSNLFTTVNAESDAIPFEGGPDRASHLAARERIRRWLTTLRTVYVLQLPFVELRVNRAPSLISTGVQEVDNLFLESISASLNRIADCLESQLGGTKNGRSYVAKVPDIFVHTNQKISAALMGVNETGPYYQLGELVDKLEIDVLREPVFSS